MDPEYSGTGSLSWVKYNFDHLLNPDALEEQKKEFGEAVRRFIKRPPDGSSYSVAMGEALLLDLQDESFDEFQSMLDYFLQARQEVPIDQKLILYRQIIVSELFDSIYKMEDMSPLGEIDFWRSSHRTMLRNESVNQKIRGTIETIINQTNIPQRYAGAVIAINAALGNDRPLKVLDIGSSSGLGLAQIYSHFDFDPFDIKGVGPDKQQRIRELLDRGIHFGKLLGLDKSPVNDFRLAEAQATQLAEFSDRERTEKRSRLYKEIKEKKLSNKIKLLHHDVLVGPAHPYNEEIFEEMGGSSADVVMELTAFYEIPDVKIKQLGYDDFVDAKKVALDSMQNFAGERGMLVVQDFFSLDPKDESQINFARDIYHPSSQYNLGVKLDREQSWIILGTWSSGRCKSFTPTQALFDLMDRSSDRRDN